MLRRSAGSKLGPLSCQSLQYRRPLLPCHLTVLPRYHSDWRDRNHGSFKPERFRHVKNRSRSAANTLILDVDTLGKPGEITVVPTRRRRMKLDKEQKPEIESHRMISSILGDLDEEILSPSGASVQQRIEEIRASYQLGETLSAGVFKALLSQLEASFTRQQLSAYISEYSSKAVLEKKDWKWNQRKQLPHIENLKGKALLAERIVRDCWQLVAEGELGQLEFQIPARFIALLLHAEHFSFHELANLHGCGIEVIQSEGLISLTGKRSECESVREVIIDSTGRIREDEIGINPSIHKDTITHMFSPEFLEWVNNTYRVFVEHKAHRIPEKILYHAENKLGADNARRTLNLALSNITSPSMPFSTYLPASELASAYTYRPDVHASWFERQKSWFRWAMSSSQNEAAERLETPFFDKHQTRLSDELLKLLRVGISETSPVAGINESVTAVVGKCLFLQEQPVDDTAISPAQLGGLSLPRTFTNDAPVVSRFIDSLSPIRSTDDAQVSRLRLSPTANTGSLPELEIEVALNSHSDGIDVHSIKAILSSNSVDYLLPENGLDLRFTRIISRDLLPKSPSHSELSEHPPLEFSLSPEIQAMIQSVKNSFQGSFVSSGPLSNAPPPVFCKISLPHDLVQQSAFQKVNPKDSDESISENNVTVEYMFPPLNEINGAIVQKYEFNGRPLDYRYCESGPFLAARTNEISLGMEISQIESATETDQSELLDHEFHSFYNAACDMAFKIHDSGHVNKQRVSIFD